jgi:hypothetical protein
MAKQKRDHVAALKQRLAGERLDVDEISRTLPADIDPALVAPIIPGSREAHASMS